MRSLVTSSLAAPALVLGLGLGLGPSACFIEPAEPSTFRFECSADADCEGSERCASGLCQQPCAGADDDPCSGSAPVCLNGYCASICPLADEVCPSPQTCMSLALPGEDPGESGVCTVACDDDTAPCPDGQICFAEFGLCAQLCMSDADCGSGETCLMGVCGSSGGGGGFP